MSDGGFDVDELLRKRRNRINLFGIVSSNYTSDRISYPSLSDDKEDYIPEKNAMHKISKKKESIEKCFDCFLKEICKLEAQGFLDLCKRE